MSADLLKLASDLTSYIGSPERAELDADDWKKIENTAQALANGLRSRGQTEDHHGIVGSTTLPRTLTALLATTRGGSNGPAEAQIPQASAKSAAYEILRIGANICMDHDANRGRLLDANYPQTVLSMLEAYSDLLMRANHASNENDCAASLSLEDLRIIKTAFGDILNVSMDYKPVREVLVERKAPGTILRLTSLIYPAGQWLHSAPSGDDDTAADLWQWRSGVSAWSWRAIETLRPTELDIAWDEEALPLLIKSLDTFSPIYVPNSPPAPEPSYPSVPSFATSRPDLRYSLLNADVTVLQEVSMLVEALTAEEERVRALLLISTGKSASVSSPDSPFVHLLRFVESGGPLPYWSQGHAELRERAGWEKALGMCKAAVIKAIVTIAGEESQMDVLWGQNDPSGGWFIEQMSRWIKEYPASRNQRTSEERDDLVICATLSLGNLSRGERRCAAILQSPLNIVSLLVPLLEPSADIKLKHGILGLFKNLVQVQSSRETLGRSGLVEAICRSKVWERDADMAEVVQLSAIGIVKHLVTSNITNALKLFTPNDGSETGLEQILDLIRRTDSLAVRNESTRILVNLVKTLWSPSSSSMSPVSKAPPDVPMQVIEDRRNAFDELCSEETADAVAEMVGRGMKYPVLLNEGIMALTLLASRPAGVPHILTALTSPLGPEAAAASPNLTRSPPISEASTSTSMANEGPSSATALDMVVSHILSPKGRSFPPELRANACSLLTSVGRHDVAVDRSDVDRLSLVGNIREAARPVLVALANEPVSQLSMSAESSSSPPTSPAGSSGPSAASGRSPNLVRNAAARTLTAFGTPVSSAS